MSENSIQFSVHHTAGLVTLNRPKALNALDFDMAVALRQQLDDWAADDAISHVVMSGNGGRAFCAGGDIRALYAMIDDGRQDQVPVFFRAEYMVDVAVAEFPKPIVSLANGVVMGGGAGLMQASSHAVVTETTKFAMPESAIGLFPDAGASVFLGRCPRPMARFLGTTGQIITGADCLMLGLASEMCLSDRLEALQTALLACDAEDIDAVLARFRHDPGPAPLQAQRAAINYIFGDDNALNIERRARDMAELKDDAFARDIHNTLTARCPMTIWVFLRLLEMADAFTDMAEGVSFDYHLAIRMTERADFKEGIRAVLVEKTNDAQWSPARLAEVTEAMVDAVFDHDDLPPLR